MNVSLRRNVVANYIGHLYGTLIAILMVPLYVRFMGMEAYGLVGFFTMLQMWFQLLDMGLTPTMTREAARFQGGAVDAVSLRRLLRALECIFVVIVIPSAAALMVAADTIASGWLKVQQLSHSEVRNAILLMAVIIALRCICALYRGAINGFEQLVWLSGFNMVIATIRFVLVIPFFIFVGASPTQFCAFQLAVAILETAILVRQTYRILPRPGSPARLPWKRADLSGVLKFSLSIAFTSSIWVLVTQTDKLLLSKLLSLTEYAYFTLAVLVASGVLIITGPISVALVPRLIKLSAQGDQVGMIGLYCNATQLVGVIAIPASLMLAFFSEQILWAWTGDAIIAANAAPVLTLYALGNGILALGAFPYYLQFANGDLKLHVVGNAVFLVILILTLIWATSQHGVVGAGYAWLGTNAVFFALYVPTVHARFVKGLHLQWLVRDVGAIALLPIAAIALLHGVMSWPEDRIAAAIVIVVVSAMSMGIAAAGSSCVREAISGMCRARFAR
jgi:O-antigen/teichoic acid export membrane protein